MTEFIRGFIRDFLFGLIVLALLSVVGAFRVNAADCTITVNTAVRVIRPAADLSPGWRLVRDNGVVCRVIRVEGACVYIERPDGLWIKLKVSEVEVVE